MNVQEYMMAHFGVDDMANMDPYNGGIPCWSLAKDVTAMATFSETEGRVKTLQNAQITSRKQHADLNLDAVSIRTLLINYGVNPTDKRCFIKSTYMHPAFKREDEMHNKLITAMGGTDGPDGASVYMEPKYDGPLHAHTLVAPENCMYLMPWFIKTMTWITPDNIMNGIVEIPGDVCAATGLPQDPTVLNEQGVETKLSCKSYFAVPSDHILAWTLHMTFDMRIEHGNYAQEMRISGPTGVRIIFLVADECFYSLYSSFFQNMAGRVDRIPINSIGIECFPVDTVKVQMGVTYVAWPHIAPETVANMAPTLHPEFAPFTRSVRMRRIADAITRMYAEAGKSVDTKIKKPVAV